MTLTMLTRPCRDCGAPEVVDPAGLCTACAAAWADYDPSDYAGPARALSPPPALVERPLAAPRFTLRPYQHDFAFTRLSCHVTPVPFSARPSSRRANANTPYRSSRRSSNAATRH